MADLAPDPGPVRAGLAGFPLTLSELERYRVDVGKRHRATQVGRHLQRRRGQSLEFRDYAEYVPGDDFRYVDWRVSHRTGTINDLVVKTFGAEENVSVAVSVDLRGTMFLPEAAPKLRIAAWLAHSIAVIGGAYGDEVVLHRLFDADVRGPVSLRGGNSAGGSAKFARDLLESGPGSGEPGLSSLLAALPPAAVWVIITDLYWTQGEAQDVLRAISRAQDGWRWVILVDLDSWPMEQAALRGGRWQIEGPGLPKGENEALGEEELLSRISGEIDLYKADQRAQLQNGGLDVTHWQWPADEETWDAGAFFRDRWYGDDVLRRLFRRDA